MGVDFDYTNYDAAPPSVRLVNPFTRTPYKFSELPTQLLRGMPAQEIQMPGMPAGAKMSLAVQQPYMQAYGPDDVPRVYVSTTITPRTPGTCGNCTDRRVRDGWFGCLRSFIGMEWRPSLGLAFSSCRKCNSIMGRRRSDVRHDYAIHCAP
jgi:hypothetical protein